MFRIKLFIILILVPVISTLSFPLSAEKPSEVVVVNAPVVNVANTPSVTVDNWPAQLDVKVTTLPTPETSCLCFTQNDLDNVSEGTSGVWICNNLRAPGALGNPKTSIVFLEGNSSGSAHVSVAYNDSVGWVCSLADADNENYFEYIVYYKNIGFEAAMACREFILNSPQWEDWCE